MELHKIETKLPFVGYGESRQGGRSENQDSFGYADTKFGLLVTVCDGMGGGPCGKTASSIAVKEIIDGVMEARDDETPSNVLLKAIHRANLALLAAVEDNPKLRGMGTTCTALLINQESAIVAHVGDSRVYQLRHGRKVFRTFDHSLVFGLVKEKVITEEQARLSDQSNIITRALGLDAKLEIDLAERVYEKGDRFMLCTDGIHGTMPEKQLIEMVSKGKNIGQTVDNIATQVDGGGRRNGGGHDNLTLALIETQKNSIVKEKMSTRNKTILVVIAALLLVSFVGNITQCSRNKKQTTKTSLSPEIWFKAFSTGQSKDSLMLSPEGDTLILKYIKVQKN
ncbi:MAG: serine/threonine-protein phosphatase [Bacteroidales bacterium]|nr:serine/threonine-protein phosphatase [Bacteroidales bacterium]